MPICLPGHKTWAGERDLNLYLSIISHHLAIRVLFVPINIFMTKKERIPTRLRRMVIERDGLRCVFCDEDLTNAEVHLDHVVPESQGGETRYANLQVTCRKCNLAKGVLNEAEFTRRLRERAINILTRIGVE